MLTKLVSFLQESKAELRRVSWPGKKKTLQLTGAVLAITLAVALFIAVVDRLFNLGIGWLIGR